LTQPHHKNEKNTPGKIKVLIFGVNQFIYPFLSIDDNFLKYLLVEGNFFPFKGVKPGIFKRTVTGTLKFPIFD